MTRSWPLVPDDRLLAAHSLEPAVKRVRGCGQWPGPAAALLVVTMRTGTPPPRAAPCGRAPSRFTSLVPQIGFRLLA
jgi:hypothetical protein